MSIGPPGAAKAEPVTEWHRIVLREDQISDILVQYVPATASPAPPGSEPRLGRWLRHGVVKLFGLPRQSTWQELLEAPTAHPAVASRLLIGEFAVLLVTALVSHLT